MMKSLHWLYSCQRNEHPERWVFRRLQKTGGDDVDVTWCSRAFQVWTATIGYSRLPMVDSRVWWTGNDDIDADHRQDWMPRSAAWRSSVARNN